MNEPEHDGGGAPDEVEAPTAHPMALHVALFVVALGTCWFAGVSFAGADPWLAASWRDAGVQIGAACYGIGLMAILYAHEMGHYVMGKRHGVLMTRPYFIPGVPWPGAGIVPFLGTFGAFIKMSIGRVRAKSLLEVGAWGPIAGFVITVPVLLVGMWMSEVKPLPEDPGEAIRLGDTLLLLLGEALFHPDIPEGHDVFLHPLAMAGWGGCLLTALNLTPIGQLDGGHIAYAVWGERYNKVAWLLWGGLVALGVFAFTGWLALAALLYWMRPTHPDITGGETVRGPGAWTAWACVLILVLTFSPNPLVLPTLAEWAWEMLGLG
jgi:membrane-associated protease RseP (regulator of RpoE activity)